MNEKTRLIETFKGNKVDRPPVICPGGMMNMINKDVQDLSDIHFPEAHKNPDQMARLCIAAVENGVFENYGVPFDMTAEAEDMGAEVDFGSDIFEPHVSGYAIKSVDHFRQLKPIDFSKGRCRDVIDAIKILKEKGDPNIPIIGNIEGPISTAGQVMDSIYFYKDLRRKPEESHAYLQFITDQLVEFGKLMVEAGADVISISDPTATGELLGPKHFVEFAVPYINQVIDAVSDKAYTIVHICGRMQPVLKEFGMIKANALSIDSLVPISKIREVLPDRVIMGNVSTYTLEFMDKDKVRAISKNAINNGADILAPACGIGIKTPIENLQAMLEEAKAHAKAPSEGNWGKIVKIHGTDERFQAEEDFDLLDALLNKGHFVDNPCNGKGTCGKCRVRVVSGDPGPVGPSEKRFLTDAQEADGMRLACYIKDWKEVEIELIQKEKKAKVLTKGYVPDFVPKYRDGYGISMDIGTTTVALSLIDLSNGETLAEESMVNMQKNYGLDVLTRISYSDDNEDGLAKLQEAIVGPINSMIYEVCQEAKIKPSQIKDIIVGANTTMAHLLLGVDPGSMGKFPYKPEFTELREVRAESIGIEAGPDTKVITLPHVSAFIGSDVVAGAYVADMENTEGHELFIDIGTNGEIVLEKDDELYACSAAAGPALEGMNISCGMRAAPGAIEDVRITEKGVELKVIDDEEPIGICGSGILAVVKELLRVGLVTSRGAFVKKEDLSLNDYRYNMIRLDGRKREFVMDEKRNLVITQEDIRQVQLAKGAILSGFVALLNEAGIGMEDLDVVYVAGQFGAHLPKESLVGTGILPPQVKDKIKYLGNSSKTGAYMALMNEDIRADMDRLAKKIKFLELAVLDNYERIFVESSLYPKYEDGKILEA